MRAVGRVIGRWPATLLVLAAFLVRFAAPIQSYLYTGTHWSAFPIPYVVNAANSDMSSADALAIIREAPEIWATADPTVSWRYDGTSVLTPPFAWDGGIRPNIIAFSSGSNGTLGALANRWSNSITHEMLKFAITVYDGPYTWLRNSDPCAGSPRLYLIDTLTHEFGHVLGMAHSDVTTAPLPTMRGSMAYCTNDMRDLAQDDINGIFGLYPPPVTPAAPSNLTATAASPTQIDLAWTDNAVNETSTTIWRSPDNVTFAQIASVGSNVRTYSSTGLLPSTIYYYKVRAANATGVSAFSNTANATTQAAAGPAPIVLSASKSQNKSNWRILLTWTGTTTQVAVYRNGARITTTTSQSYTDSVRKSRVSTGTIYTYQVCYVDTTTCSNTVAITF